MTNLPNADSDGEIMKDFSVFFREEWATLVARARWRTRDDETAEDIANEAMSSLYNVWAERPRTRWQCKAYLNGAVDSQAARIGSRIDKFTALFRKIAPLLHADERNSNGVPHDHAELYNFVRSLPDRQRAVLSLHFLGYSNDEIARQLDMVPNTVSSNLRHAKKSVVEKFRKQIASEKINDGSGFRTNENQEEEEIS